jgi:hypothetical protein
MISSEVQRTLVKSPPELWAELSDPGALARHLGELGEIRITRVEPETVVEWEADGASGRVHIAPSGWGTKVTLSVEQETPAPAEPDVAPVPEPIAAIEPPDTPQPTNDHGPDPEPAPAPAPPALTLAERFALADAEPLLHSPLDDPTTGEHGERAEDVGEAAPDEDAEVPAAAAEDPPSGSAEATPRRGFFARLVGRLLGVPDAPPSESAPVPSTPSASRAEEPPAPARAERPPAPIPVDHPERDPAALRTSPLAPATAAGAAHAAGAVASSLSPPAIAAQMARERMFSEPEVASPPEADVQAPPAPEPEADVPAPPAPEPERDPAPEPEQDLVQPEQDLAAELREAEEAASERVTAMLTGMLDRLGAAHHRPFSRA